MVAVETVQAMDAIDKKLLNLLQWEFTLDVKPFEALAEKVGTTEKDVITRINRLKDSGVIRQINAIFDTRMLGYKSSLIAMQIDNDLIDEVALKISEHHGVSHNYKRDHQFNLWFTLAVPPNGSLDDEVAKMARIKGVRKIRLLQTKKLFKIGVKLDVEHPDPESPVPNDVIKKKSVERKPLTKDDIARIVELQKDLELVPRPFLNISRRLGITEKELLAVIKKFEERGIMRRFAAILRHQKAGFVANGMVTWKVPEDRIEDVAKIAISFSQVSHCYQRPVYEDWPYNLFTMVHARSKESCERIAQEISKRTGMTEYAILYSTKEYKKERVQYFV